MIDAGLCGSCVHCRVIESSKGSVFRLCEKALRDAAFPKYPRLPVRQCAGWIRIRAAAPADLDAVQRIYAHWVLNGVASFELEPPDAVEIARRHAEIGAQGLPYLVAEVDGGRIAGYAYATLYRSRPAYRFTVEDSVYLDASFAGQGIGRRLLDAVIAECARQGYRQMIAVIGGGLENAASVALHTRCGFERAGVLKGVGYKFDAWQDTALMQRKL